MSRSTWKPIFVEKNVKNAFNWKKKNKNFIIKVFSRSSTILASFVGFNIKVYNGIKYYDLFIKREMVGHKFGEFAPTRKKPLMKKNKK